MVYKCKVTDIEWGESKKYATPYTYFKDDKPIGRVVFTKKIGGKWKGWYRLSNVIIYPEYRGIGLCDKMLKCALKKYNNEKVYLEVDKNNTSAIKCYLKCGFKVKDDGKKIIMIKGVK